MNSANQQRSLNLAQENADSYSFESVGSSLLSVASEIESLGMIVEHSDKRDEALDWFAVSTIQRCMFCGNYAHHRYKCLLGILNVKSVLRRGISQKFVDSISWDPVIVKRHVVLQVLS